MAPIRLDAGMNARGSRFLTACLLALAAALFVERAWFNASHVNTRISRTDQGAYIKQAIDARMSDFTAMHPRNRMPVYPTLLAAFMDKDELAAAASKNDAAQAFFDRGKLINIALALAASVFAAVVFFRCFPAHHAWNLTLFSWFTVLVFKAGHVQAEILYYTLTFAAFLACWRLFRRPSWWMAVLAGGLAALAHLTKASVLPGLLVLAVFLPLDALWIKWRGLGPARSRLLATTLVLGAFLLGVFPYISKSKEVFGRYFYNVNSTFYIWTDSWEEATSRTRAAGDRKGWPDLPPEEIPSLRNYLRDHSAGHIAWRIVEGVSVVFNSMARSYGYLGICLAYLAAAIGCAAAKWSLVWRVVRRRPVPFLALLAYFAGYYLLYAWYARIIDGNRFVLALFLPFLFAVSAVIVALAPRIRFRLAGKDWDALHAINIVLSVWIGIEVATACALRIPSMYGGG